MPRPYATRRRWSLSSSALKRWGTRSLLALLVLLSGWLLVNFVRMAWIEHQLEQASAQQQALNEAQRQRNLELAGEAAYRESDVYVERAAREKLGMAREGETVLLPTVVLPSPGPTPQPTPPLPPQASPEPFAAETLPNYRRWWQAFFPPSAEQP